MWCVLHSLIPITSYFYTYASWRTLKASYHNLPKYIRKERGMYCIQHFHIQLRYKANKRHLSFRGDIP